jgi:hypothetical protein
VVFHMAHTPTVGQAPDYADSAALRPRHGGVRATSSPVSLTGAGYEVGVKLDRPSKVAAFCRELGDTALGDLARQENMEAVLRRAEESLHAGRAGPELEADLDALDAMVWRMEGQGMYPPVTRTAYPGALSRAVTAFLVGVLEGVRRILRHATGLPCYGN